MRCLARGASPTLCSITARDPSTWQCTRQVPPCQSDLVHEPICWLLVLCTEGAACQGAAILPKPNRPREICGGLRWHKLHMTEESRQRRRTCESQYHNGCHLLKAGESPAFPTQRLQLSGAQANMAAV